MNLHRREIAHVNGVLSGRREVDDVAAKAHDIGALQLSPIARPALYMAHRHPSLTERVITIMLAEEH